ncbi:hypothetical protein [Texcoconibacillus texcoconensis]|uniref:Uncharacterized protein n=1 Tax=Texcoconibacillus texcoconensis TaxID=1095777 RepID=A0A840QLJ0_9BACI|nr:hypothetical protein [Texcoconibacillus texcoconensis]MBB5172228.1 hypothetical protein [Texcoconibacillus texcoconensis]
MEQVIQTFQRKDGERRIPVLKMEIDYELLTLHEALQSNDETQVAESKEKLDSLRIELLKLEV